MSQMSNGIVGLVAATAVFGAIQLASGSDLATLRGETQQARTGESVVNRAAKADRAVPARWPIVKGTTVSFKTDRVAETSVLMRLTTQPLKVDTVSNGPVPITTPTPARRSTIACEPVVSVLTEVAKHLQPGRCIT